MNRIEAIIRPSKLASVRDALAQIGVAEMVVERHRPKLKIVVIVAAEKTQQVAARSKPPPALDADFYSP